MYNNICSIVGDADIISDCRGIDLEDPASIYLSDDDDDLDGNDDGSWENSEEDQNGHQWNTPPSKHSCHHTAMVTMIQMVTMMKVGGTLKRGKAGSSGNTNTAHLTFTLHS